MADLTQAQWTEQLATDDNAIIVDVRTSEEISEGHIPNAQHLDVMNPGSFMDGANKMDPSKNYYIYCKSGGRSAQACAIMNSIGFNNTYNLLGGFSNWQGEVTQ